jgi:hypothetical protein
MPKIPIVQDGFTTRLNKNIFVGTSDTIANPVASLSSFISFLYLGGVDLDVLGYLLVGGSFMGTKTQYDKTLNLRYGTLRVV